MNAPTPGLAFEQPIFELESQLYELQRSAGDDPEAEQQIRDLRRELADTIKHIYGALSPW